MANLPDASDPDHLRASDTDRERIAAILRDAADQGRLSPMELDERLMTALQARTYSELQPLVADLPYSERSSHANQRTFDDIALGGTRKMSVAFMSGFHRRGAWSVGRTFTAITFMGGGVIDLRDVSFLEGEVTIQVLAWMGGVEVIVPDDSHVQVGGFALMGGFGDHTGGRRGTPNAPRVNVTGFALMGGISVKRRPRQPDRD